MGLYEPLMNANVNKNLSMSKYSDFYSNVEDKDKVNAYKSIRNMMDQLKGTESDEAIQDFYFKSYNAGTLNYNVPQLEQSINEFNNMLESGKGSMYAMDLETLGNPFGDETEKALFAITEMTLTKKDVASGAITDVQNVLFGLNDNNRKVYEALIARAELHYDSFSQVEKSTLERLARYGAYDTKTEVRNGVAILTNLGTSSPMNLDNAKRGLNMLSGLKGQAWGGKYATDQLSIMSNYLNGMKGPFNTLFTHNGTKFDLPVINEAMLMHGVAKVNNDINHIDLQAQIHTAYNGDILGMLTTARETNGVRGRIKGQAETLDKLAESFGMSTHAHVAANDNRTLLNVLTAPLRKTKDGVVTLAQELQQRINAYSALPINQDISANNVANRVIFAKQSIYTNGLD
jgi:hypothetical protein